MIHLDTNFLIDALVPGSPQETQMEAWLAAGETPGISAVAWGEFLPNDLAGKIFGVKNRIRCLPIFYRQFFTSKSYSLFDNRAASSSGALRPVVPQGRTAGSIPLTQCRKL